MPRSDRGMVLRWGANFGKGRAGAAVVSAGGEEACEEEEEEEEEEVRCAGGEKGHRILVQMPGAQHLAVPSRRLVSQGLLHAGVGEGAGLAACCRL